MSLFLGLSASSYGLDLVETYDIAQSNDARYASARQSYVAGQQTIPQARALLLPNIKGSVDYTDSHYDLGKDQGTRHGNNTIYALNLSQPLLDLGAWRTYQQAEIKQLINEASLLQAQQDLILRVAQAYFDVLSAQDDVQLFQAQRLSIEQQLTFAQHSFEVGNATITDSLEAQARYDLISAQLIQAENQLELKKSALSLLINQEVHSLAQLKSNLDVSPPNPPTIQPWIDQAKQQNIYVIQQTLLREVAQSNVSIAKTGHYPTIALKASVDHNNGDMGASRPSGTTSSNVGISLQMPIFSGFATSSKVEQNIALREKADYDLEVTKRDIEQSTKQAFLGLQTGLSQVMALRAAETSSRKALEATQTGFDVGVRINIDVLNAQQQLYSTQRDLAKARYNTLLSSLSLKAASGSLNVVDLEAINQLLDR